MLKSLKVKMVEKRTTIASTGFRSGRRDVPEAGDRPRAVRLRALVELARIATSPASRDGEERQTTQMLTTTTAVIA